MWEARLAAVYRAWQNAGPGTWAETYLGRLYYRLWRTFLEKTS